MVNITSGMRSRPTRAIEFFQRGDVHVALEGMPRRRLPGLGNRQIDGLGADELDVGARGVEVRVVRHQVARLAHHVEQNALGGASLVGGDYVLVAEDILHRVAKVVEAAAAGIALVAQHDSSPLPGRHRARARIGEQVDEHVVGRKQKQVVVRGAQQRFPLLARGPADGLDTLDAKRLNDGLGQHGIPLV